MRPVMTRLIAFSLLLFLSFSAQAENTLVGKWDLMMANSRDVIGTLSANGRYFTISLKEPKADFTAGYTQAPNGDFRCTVIDNNVLVLEGRFQDRKRFNLGITVKEIGKPETRDWALVAVRDE